MVLEMERRLMSVLSEEEEALLETLVLRLRSVGKPLMLGLALVATGVGLLTYVLVTWIWFAKVKWSRRQRRTATGRAPAE